MKMKYILTIFIPKELMLTVCILELEDMVIRIV